MIHLFYRDDDGNIVEITDRFNLDPDGPGIELTTNAEEQTVATSQVVGEDPDDDWAISGHRVFFIAEDLATYYDRIWAGYTAARTYLRGDTYRTVGGHDVRIELSDLNTVLGRRVLVGADCDRPAETDVERMEWLVSTSEMSLIDDTTYLSTADPVDMSAANYLGQMTSDVIRDCMDQSGKNCFVYEVFNSPDYEFSLWYDFGSSTELSSELRISNVLTDIDADAGAGDPGAGQAWTWAASLDTELQRDPSRVYSGVYGNYDGGAIYRQLPGTITAFANRDTVTNWPNVKTGTQAIARDLRYLDDISTEEDVITTTIEVTPEHVNDARAGERIQCRFSHLPGYELEFSWMRILNRTVTYVTPWLYRIKYTLSAQPSNLQSCSLQLSGMAALLWDSGNQDGADLNGPLVIPVGTPSDHPSVMVAGVYMRNGYSTLGYVIGVTGFTPTGDSGPGTWPVPDDLKATFAGMSYKAVPSGGPGNLTVSWTPGGADGKVQSWRSFAAEVHTAATSPVQVAQQIGSGGSATFPGTPTPGNVIVLFRICETGGFSSDPTGFTLLASATSVSSAPSVATIQMWAYCVQPGDDATYGTGDASFTHHAFLSEWAIE